MVIREEAKNRQFLIKEPAVFILVGMTGFEPAAFYSRSKRATKLRHIPILSAS